MVFMESNSVISCVEIINNKSANDMRIVRTSIRIFNYVSENVLIKL